jgi:cytochrome P450
VTTDPIKLSSIDEIEDRFDPMAMPSHEEFVALAHTMQDLAPVYYWKRYDMWVVTQYAAVLEILRETSTYSVRGKLSATSEWYTDETWQILGPTSQRMGAATMVMGSADPPDHERLRGPFKKAFQPRAINLYEPLVREICEELVDEIYPRGAAEWSSQFAKLVPMRVILQMLGLPRSDAAQLARWSDSMVDLTSAVLDPAEQADRARDVAAFEDYMRDATARRRAEPGKYPGLMSDVLAAIADGQEQMTDDELAATWTIEMLLGGHETVGGSLVSSLHRMLTNRPLWDELCADPSKIPDAVEELLRYESAALGLFRRTTKEVTLCGVTIPEGSRIYFLNYVANHDPRQFPDPERVQFDRPNASSHLTFGKGLHNCIGAPVARLEMKVAYEVLTRRMPGLRVAQREPLEYSPSFRVRVPKRLYVEWPI